MSIVDAKICVLNGTFTSGLTDLFLVPEDLASLRCLYNAGFFFTDLQVSCTWPSSVALIQTATLPISRVT